MAPNDSFSRALPSTSILMAIMPLLVIRRYLVASNFRKCPVRAHPNVSFFFPVPMLRYVTYTCRVCLGKSADDLD